MEVNKEEHEYCLNITTITKNDSWIIDSGASYHICNFKENVFSLARKKQVVIIANGIEETFKEIDLIELKFLKNQNIQSCKIIKVYFTD